ncbi:MAG: hypothetical protein ACK5LP_06510 [Campylobacteraceae bacterium]
MLKKIISSTLCVLCFSFIQAKAELVDAVSVVVESEPITLFEIYKYSRQYNLNMNDALELLVRQKLEISQVKRMNIVISDYDVDQQLNEIATRNNLSVQGFINAIAAEGVKIEDYKEDIRKKMQRDRLYQYIFRDRIQQIDQDEALRYYNANKNEFARVESFDVTRYQGSNLQAVNSVVSPLMSVSGVESIRLRLQSQTAEARIVSLLTNTNVGSMSQTIETKDGYVKFMVHAKNGESVLPYEQAQNMIMQKLSQDQEKAVVEEYFEKLKSSASIVVVRLP